MAEKYYDVLEGQKYVGKHRIYTEGMKVPEEEIIEGTLEIALNGAATVFGETKDGKPITNAKGEKLIVKKGTPKKLRLVTEKKARK
jgi:hypothetical protein